MNNRTYLTTPIYYVNDKPHIGHVYTDVCFDVLSRYYRLLGDKVFMLSGTDEHGQKNEQTATKLKRVPIQLCTENSKKFKEILQYLNCAVSYSKEILDSESIFFTLNNDQQFETNFNSEKNFIRTTEGRNLETGEITEESFKNGRHIKYVNYIWNILIKNGWIYEDTFSGWYCQSDECFYDENELINGKSPTNREVQWKTEKVHFFRLSVFQRILFFIFDFAKTNYKKDFIFPESRYKEIMSFLSGFKDKDSFDDYFLKDLCISRETVKWGIPVPNDENERTIYVWIDALSNYLSAISDLSSDEVSCSDFNLKINKEWFSFDKKIHLVGKDIIRFHAIYWPAILIAANFDFETVKTDSNRLKDCFFEKSEDLYQKYSKTIPESILSHGWWTNNGEKISKSLNNGIYLEEEVDRLLTLNEIKKDIAVDYFRYFFIKAINIGSDGDYSRSSFANIVNKNISSEIGNFYSRIMKMFKKRFENSFLIVDLSKIEIYPEDLKFIEENKTSPLFDKNSLYNIIDSYKINELLLNISEFSGKCANYIEKIKPWTLEDERRTLSFLSVMSYCVIVISISTHPVIPFISNSLLSSFIFDETLKYNDLIDLKNYFKNVKIDLSKVQDNLCPRVIFSWFYKDLYL